MTITLSMHRRLNIHLVRLEGVVTFSELAEMARLHAALPMLAAADAIHMIEPDADLSQIKPEHLDVLRAHYADLQRRLDLYLVRRSAWVCSTAAACRLVEYWLHGRHSRDGQKTELVMGADLAGVFPLFSREEIEAVQTQSGFTEIARIGERAVGRGVVMR